MAIILLLYTLAAIVGLLWLTRYLVDRLLKPCAKPLPVTSPVQQNIQETLEPTNTDITQQNPEPTLSNIETNHQAVLFIVSILGITCFIAFFIGLEINALRHQTMQNTSPLQSSSIENKRNAIVETTAKITQQAPVAPNTVINENNENKNNMNMSIRRTATEETQVSLSPPSVSSGILADDAKIQLKQYIKQHYSTLYYQQAALKTSIKQLQNFFDQIDSIAQRSPLHRRFLAEITKNRWQLQQQFRHLEKTLAADLLTFWAYYQVGSPTHTGKEFSKIAQRMTEQIQTLLEQAQNKMEQRNQLLIKDYMNYLLGIIRQPVAQKTFPTYRASNSVWLRQWLKQQNMKVIEAELQDLDNQDALIQQSIANIKNYQINYPEIADRLNKSLSLWKQAKYTSEQMQFRIYHLVEASYLMANSKLDLEATTAQTLIGALIQRLPKISDEMNASLQAAQNAYQTDISQ